MDYKIEAERVNMIKENNILKEKIKNTALTEEETSNYIAKFLQNKYIIKFLRNKYELKKEEPRKGIITSPQIDFDEDYDSNEEDKTNDAINNGKEIYETITPMEYFIFYNGTEQKFTTTSELLKGVKVGDELKCENIDVGKYDKLTESYNLKVIEGINKGKVIKIEDEDKFHKEIGLSLLNPNLEYEDNIEVKITGISANVVTFVITNLNHFMIVD